MVDPGLLPSSSAARTDVLDCPNLSALAHFRGHHAAALRLAVDVHGTCSALRNPASEFRSVEPDLIANDPEKWRVTLNVEVVDDSVDLQPDRHRNPPRKGVP